MPRILTPPRQELLAALEAAELDFSIRATERLAGAHDASHYQLTPEAVVTARTVGDVAAAMIAARETGTPLTFRSGGTSLSGQAGTSGLLLDTRRNFRGVRVTDGGERVVAEPGATIRSVNARLLRHERKLGPDPASEIACTIGGVVANNSSGMCCGIQQNAYRTIESMVLVLPSGTVVDTARTDAEERLRCSEPQLHEGLLRLRDRIHSNAESVAALRRLHSIKNTMGYGLNSFLDHERPVDILQHLVIGSEGTLAFVAEATFRTVPLRTHCATGLLIFPTLAAATAALPDLVETGFAAIELMDATSLGVAQRDPEATEELRALAVGEQAALLVEFQEDTASGLAERVRTARDVFAGLPLCAPAELTAEAATRARLWHIRKGLFTAVAGARASGTTSLLEDIAVPVERLYETCEGLAELFRRHGYRDSVIFGHAKDGNIHFLLNERFDDPAAVERYVAFTEEMVDLVLGKGGTLKAEHGTGRIMAPFVRRQYGDELYTVMQEVKRLIDPEGVLNPGVLLSDDPRAHLQSLKLVPTVEEEVDRCVECGYCEPVCPSKDLTLTPRQRIVLRREMARADAAGDEPLLRRLHEEYDYSGVQTCAVDGMCQTACPVLIDTGDLVRRLRTQNQGRMVEKGWALAARHWEAASTLGGAALTMAQVAPTAVPAAASRLARALLGEDAMPLYSGDLPRGGRRRPVLTPSGPAAVAFFSCTSTMFGAEEGEGVASAVRRLCEYAGVTIATPPDLPSLCCGTPWKSKGRASGYREMRQRVTASLDRATRGGELPVVCDAASCTEGLEVLLSGAREMGIRVIDAVAFVDEMILPELPQAARVASLTLHPTCSSRRLGLDGALGRVAAAAAEHVTVPVDWGCCGFAGDRGMLHPELTASATRAESRDVAEAASAVHASLNRTCEIGMTRATGQAYRHVLEVLADAVDAASRLEGTVS